MYKVKIGYWSIVAFFFILTTAFPFVNNILIMKTGIKVNAIIKKRSVGNISGGSGVTCYYVAKTSFKDSIININTTFDEFTDFRNYKSGDVVSVVLLKDKPYKFLFNDKYERIYNPITGILFTIFIALALYLMYMIGVVWFPNIGQDG